MGGLARRVSYIKTFQERFKDTPSVSVDSGYFLGDEQTTHGRPRVDAVAKNEWVLKAYDQFPVDVLNVSARDLTFLSELMTRAELTRRASSHPILKRMVSANIAARSPQFVSPRRFIIKEIPDKASSKASSRPIRVAFVGLSELKQQPPTGFKIADPVEAAKTAVPEAARMSDVVIILSHGPIEQAARIAREVPGIDVIIAGNSQENEQLFTPPIVVGQTPIVFTPYETRMLGELRFYRDAEGKFTTKERFISLDGVVPDNPAARDTAAAAVKAETEARRVNKELLTQLLAMTRIHSTARAAAQPESKPTSGYVSSAACAQCHTAQYMKWTSGAHARTTDGLVKKSHEFEASCLACHASGYTAGGPEEARMAKLANVQCEQCHGPGGQHAAKPAKGYGRIVDMKAVCASCHTAETSPNFDLQAAWEKIKH